MNKYSLFSPLLFLVLGCSSQNHPPLELSIKYYGQQDSPHKIESDTVSCPINMESVIKCEDKILFQTLEVKEIHDGVYYVGKVVSHLDIYEFNDTKIIGIYTSEIVKQSITKNGPMTITYNQDTKLPSMREGKKVTPFTIQVKENQNLIINGLANTHIELNIKPHELGFLKTTNGR